MVCATPFIYKNIFPQVVKFINPSRKLFFVAFLWIPNPFFSFSDCNIYIFFGNTFYNKRKETHGRNSKSLAFTNISFLFKIQYIWWEGCCIHKASSSQRVSRSSKTHTDRSKNAHLHSSSDVCYCLRITGFPFF